MFNELAVDECMRKLVEHDNLAALTIDLVIDELLLLHHLTRIGDTIKKKVAKERENRLVLNGFGTTPSIAR